MSVHTENTVSLEDIFEGEGGSSLLDLLDDVLVDEEARANETASMYKDASSICHRLANTHMHSSYSSGPEPEPEYCSNQELYIQPAHCFLSNEELILPQDLNEMSAPMEREAKTPVPKQESNSPPQRFYERLKSRMKKTDAETGEKNLSTHKIQPGAVNTLTGVDDSTENKKTNTHSPDDQVPEPKAGKKKASKWKKSTPWSHLEEVFLVGAVFERLFSRGSLNNPGGKSERKESKNECWESLKSSYDRSLKGYLNRLKKKVKFPDQKKIKFQDRTVMALTRHYKVMKARIQEKLSKNGAHDTPLQQASFRKLFREYEDLVLADLEYNDDRDRARTCSATDFLDPTDSKRKKRKTIVL